MFYQMFGLSFFIGWTIPYYLSLVHVILWHLFAGNHMLWITAREIFVDWRVFCLDCQVVSLNDYCLTLLSWQKLQQCFVTWHDLMPKRKQIRIWIKWNESWKIFIFHNSSHKENMQKLFLNCPAGAIIHAMPSFHPDKMMLCIERHHYHAFLCPIRREKV